jgi:hypothetical protein
VRHRYGQVSFQVKESALVLGAGPGIAGHWLYIIRSKQPEPPGAKAAGLKSVLRTGGKALYLLKK